MSDLANHLYSSIINAAQAGLPVVFPSELTAQFWRRTLVRDGTVRAVREDRFLSWDRFKEQAFDLRTEEAPVNSVWRELFVRALLRENASAPFLQQIVPAKYAANAGGFRQLILRTLPALKAFSALAQSTRSASWIALLMSDLEQINRRYTAFLAEHGLYEPRWLATAPAFNGGDYLLIHPELAEDWPQFAEALEGCSRLSVPDSPPDRLLWFRNSRQELRAVLQRIGDLLDSGVLSSDIVLTVCDLDVVRARLAEQAKLLSIPIGFAAGVPLSQSSAGRLLSSIQETVRSGFSVAALKALLLTPSIPWKSYQTNADAVLSGVSAGAIGGRGPVDPGWSRLKSGPQRELIDTLRNLLPGLVAAPSAGELRRRYARFASELFDAELWNPEEERVLQRAIEELRGLALLEERYGITVPDPFRFWLDQLDQTMYVPAARGGGVTVAPYRVSAGMMPAHHFVLNANQSATTVRVDPFPFLSDAQREQLPDDGPGRDLTDAFLAGYAVSGREVHFSASAESFSGPALQPGVFVVSGTIDAPVDEEPDAYQIERRIGSGVPEHAIFSLQLTGAREYARVENQSGHDFSRVRIGRADLRAELLARQSSQDASDLLRFSSDDLDRFFACPFGYLLSRPLGLRDLDFTIDPDSPRELGTLYHDTLETFFAYLHEQNQIFDAGRIDEYRTMLHEMLEQMMRNTRMIPVEAHAARRPLYRRVVDRVLQIDAELIDGHRPEYVEAWKRTTLVDDSVELFGRIDRVTRAEDGTLILVDYKKGDPPKNRAINAGSSKATGVQTMSPEDRALESRKLESVQIPLYIHLLRAHGEQVSTAAFVSLEKEGLTVVVAGPDHPGSRKAVMDPDRMDEIQLLLRERISEAARLIRDGDYRSGESCDSCPFRGVCRAEFVVR